MASQQMLRARPSFSRTSSNSSSTSTTSNTNSKSNTNTANKSERDSSSESVRHPSSSAATEYFQHTGRGSTSTVSSISTSATSSSATSQPLSRSRPIAIQLPHSLRRPRINTPDEPVSARGDLVGGYFPNHEPDLQPSYSSHPFQNGVAKGSSISTSMSGQSSPISSSTPTGPAVNSTNMQSRAPQPDNFVMPMGKYHPANYKNKNPPQTPPASTAQHARQPSDIKSKLQQYQREMAQQAMMASRFTNASGTKPTSPRLLPLGSPGPVTPMELEESAGYLVAGGGGAHLTDSQSEMVGRMIRAEEERRRREGTSSPTAMAGGTH